MAQLRFQPRPTLWHPRLKPEVVAELPLRIPNPVWAALPHILVRRIRFWCVLSSLLFTFILFQQDGFVVPSMVIVTVLWLVILVSGIIQYQAIRADFETFRIGIEIHENFLRIPYLLEQDMPWENVKSYLDLDFNGSRDPCVMLLLYDETYLRERFNPFYWYCNDALYIGLPLGHNWRYVATALTTAAHKLGNAVEYSEVLFAPKIKPAK